MNLGQAHETRFCHLLGLFSKFSDEHPRHFYTGVTPPRGSLRQQTVETLFKRNNESD